MVSVLTTALVSVAEISNLFSVLGVLICFCCMVIFIITINGDLMTSSSVIRISSSVSRYNYEKIEIPFSLSIIDKHSASYSSGIKVQIQSKIPYDLHYFWGVPSSDIGNVLYMPWAGFLAAILKNNIQCYESGYMRFDTFDDVTLLLKPAKIMPTLLGPAPRSIYPLVLCLKRALDGSEADTNIGALISLIHIKSEDMDISTGVLYQYLKQLCGQVTVMQTLFTQSPEKLESNCTEDNPSEDFDACVVCKTNSTVWALLPCRHVCVCNICGKKLVSCPMCRTRILGYFLTSQEVIPNAETPQSLPKTSFLSNILQKFSLGYT